MFPKTSFFLTKILPKSLWQSKLFEISYQRPLYSAHQTKGGRKLFLKILKLWPKLVLVYLTKHT